MFRGQDTDFIPVAPHWWGVYKFDLAREAGIGEAATGEGNNLAAIDEFFYKTFHPDWFHLGAGEWKIKPDEEREKEKSALLPELRKLKSRKTVDEYVALSTLTGDEIRQTGVYNHVKILVSKYGDMAFIAMNEGNPICNLLDPHGILGFEQGLIALIEKPRLVERLCHGLYEARLPFMKVLAEYGCHGYIGSETYISADLVSPDVYRRVVFPAQKDFYKSVRTLGLEPIIYFCGDINPLIPFINELDVTALLVEEGKKGFRLNPEEIRKQLATHITLFGNLDSVHTLLFGTPGDVERETLMQLETAFLGRFVMANGSPLASGTPRENIETMIRTTRRFGLNSKIQR